MVAPVTGPINKFVDSRAGPNNAQVYSKASVGYRQRRPYNLPLAASATVYRASGITDTRAPQYPCAISDILAQGKLWRPGDSVLSQKISEAVNLAYARFSGELGVDGGLGITLAQRREAIGMMASRAQRLADFALLLSARNYVGAAKALLIDPKQLKNLNLRSGAKFFGDNFLEFHFGWSPLVHDIYQAIDVIHSDIPPAFVKSSGKSVAHNLVNTTTQYSKEYRKWDLQVKAKISAHLRVVNPNLRTASRLGLVNPAQIAWDAIPFSFVVDWFVNVNYVLSSWTTTAGIIIDSACSSYVAISDYDELWVVSNPVYRKTYKGRGVYFSRSLGISGPSLKVKKPWQLSVTRGATAISLLLQRLR